MTKYDKTNPASIQAMFNSIAKSYDRTNAVLSFQMHRLWNRELVRQTALTCHPDTMLDLCCGTGEIAFNYLKKAQKPCHMHLLDFSEGMLLYAKEKAKQLNIPSCHQLSYIQADAQAIPLQNASISCATMAYGIRNIKDPAACMREVYRTLKPGGSFGILELTEPSNAILRLGHRAYLRTALPTLGWFLTSNQEAYQYLCNSIHTFIKPAELQRLMMQAGFEKITISPLMGGIATILFAKKPL